MQSSSNHHVLEHRLAADLRRVAHDRPELAPAQLEAHALKVNGGQAGREEREIRGDSSAPKVRPMPEQAVSHIAVVGQLDAIERKRVLHLAAHHAPRPQQHVAAQVCPTPEDAALADHARTTDERT